MRLVRGMPPAQSSEQEQTQKFSKRSREGILSLRYLLCLSDSQIPGPRVLLPCFTTYMATCRVRIPGQLQNCSTGPWLVITHINLQLTQISHISVHTRGACAVNLPLGRV